MWNRRTNVFYFFLRLQEGEHVAKLEKADILELTVRHLQKLRHQNQLAGETESYVDRFRAGFKHCATEVTQFLGGIDQNSSVHIVKHLNSCIRRLDGMQPLKEVQPMSARPKINYQQQSQLTSNTINPTQMYNVSTTPPVSPQINVDDLPVWRPW